MVFYHYVKEYVKAKCDIRTTVSSCKDNKDRGNTSASIDEALHNLRLGKDNDPKALYDLYVRSLAPFMIKMEGIIEKDRLGLLIEVLNHIAKLSKNLSPQQIQELRAYSPIPGFRLMGQSVPRER